MKKTEVFTQMTPLDEILCLYQEGKYQEVIYKSAEIIQSVENGQMISGSELEFLKNLLGECFSKIKEQSDFIDHFSESMEALSEFDKKNYKGAIESIERILGSSALSTYSDGELNTLMRMLARSYEQIGDYNKALELYESIYPQLISSSDNHFGQDKMVLDSIIELRTCQKVNFSQSDFFNLDAQSFFNAAMDKLNNRDYLSAINLFDKALTLYIKEQKVLISQDCLSCYAYLAFAYSRIENFSTAQVKLNMAFAILRQGVINPQETESFLASLNELKLFITTKQGIEQVQNELVEHIGNLNLNEGEGLGFI